MYSSEFYDRAKPLFGANPSVHVFNETKHMFERVGYLDDLSESDAAQLYKGTISNIGYDDDDCIGIWLDGITTDDLDEDFGNFWNLDEPFGR